MSWASKRQTTRIEDQAYSLMGLFGVNMPLLYGEGTKAFFRLQLEIQKNTDDESLYAWTEKSLAKHTQVGMFGSSPMAFSDSQHIYSIFRGSRLQ